MSGMRMPNGRMNHAMNSSMSGNQQRMVAREPDGTYGRSNNGLMQNRNRGGMQNMNGGGNMQNSMNMQNPGMHMDAMMDYGMLDMGDPYGMFPPFMPMHPAEASMGMSMDQMMDFPTPRYVPPMRRGSRPPRIEGQGSMGDMLDRSPHSTNSPHMRSPHHGIPGTVCMGPQSMVAMVPTGQYPIKKRKERAPSTTSFPSKLYNILADPAYKDYIAWLPHGRAWRVLKPKAFEEIVIPKFFRSDRYASFMRQVNGWGFKRITEGPDLNSYYHEMFLRGLPHICAKMRRPLKGQAAAAKELGQCPDFYKISQFAPLPPPKAPPKSDSPNMLQDKQKTDDLAELAKTKSPGVVSRDDMAREEDDAKKESAKTMEEAPKSPTPEQHQKSNVNNFHSPSSLNSIEEGALRGMIAANGGMPSTPEHNKAPDFAASNPGLDYASAGNSITSWHDPQEHELTWGNTNGPFPDDAYHQSLVAMGQVTPPRSTTIKNFGGSMPMSSLQSPHGEESDTSGLSVADLCYLTQQNQILMDQSHKRSDGPN